MGQDSAGFGDLVEKVNPAVVSVRVQLEASTKTNGIEGTFRKFEDHEHGKPDAKDS